MTNLINKIKCFLANVLNRPNWHEYEYQTHIDTTNHLVIVDGGIFCKHCGKRKEQEND